MRREHPRVGAVEGDERGITGPSQFAQTRPQPLMQRKGEFHPGSARAHHSDTRPAREV